MSWSKFKEKEGIIIDTSGLKFKNYKKTVFKTHGTWEELSDYTSLVILSKRGKKGIGDKDMRAFMPGNPEWHTTINELFIMKKDHISRVFIVNYKNKKEVIELATN